MAENPDGRWEPYVRVFISILRHRKTLRLRRILGLKTRREAVGLVVALFLFTLENAWQDGDLSKYAPEDIEEQLEWGGEEGELIRALQECGRDKERDEPGFLVGLKVNDWAGINKRLIDGRTGRQDRRTRMRAPAGPAISRGPAQRPDPKVRALEELKRRGVV